MMSKKRAFVKKETNLNKKDELFNDLVKLLKTSRVVFSSTTAASDGSYCLEELTTNVLWYNANDHLTISKASEEAKEVTPIPKLYQILR